MSTVAPVHRSATRLASPVTPGLVTALALVGAAVWAVSVAFVVHSVPSTEAATRGAVHALVVGMPLIAGLYVIQVPKHARFGLQLLAAGLAWSVTALAEADDSLLYSIGRVSGWLVFPTVIFLALAFPQGRIGPGLDRALFRALNLVLVLLFIGSALFVERYPGHTPWASCLSRCPANAFLIVDHQPAIMTGVVQPV